MTPDTALRLKRLLGMEAQFWLNLQLAWDLYHATHSSAAATSSKSNAFQRLQAITNLLSKPTNWNSVPLVPNCIDGG